MSSLSKYILMSDAERRDAFEEMALLYCDGVGGTITGPIYKGMATTFVVGIAGALAAYLLSMVSEGYDKALFEIQSVTQKMNDACSGEINQLFLNAKRILIPGANDMCAYYEKQIVDLKQTANAAARWVVGYLFSLFTSVFFKPVKGATMDLANLDFRLTRAKEGLWNMMGNMDNGICYVASLIERMLTSCGARQQVEEALPHMKF
tara:strand:+ start:360 stop:977 length:618 start_codon:yes stop_codon:yes gene_type:complete